MDLARTIQLAFLASIWLLVFGLGLRASPQDATYLFRRPSLLTRSLLTMYVVVPLLVVVVTATFDLYRPVNLALLVMAVSPVPPILPGKQLKVGGRASYVYGLLVAASLAAIVLAPLEVRVLGWIAGHEEGVSPLIIGKVVLLTVLAPLIVGLVVRSVSPARADGIATVVTLVGSVLLGVGMLVILVVASHEILSLVGNGTILAIAAIVVGGLIAGHALGGPNSRDRSALAIAASTRHPGVALAIAQVNFPDERLVSAAVLLFVVVAIIVSIPYVKWRTRSHVAEDDTF
jgi:BASS family bile acid:Na+ symporter